MPPGAKARASYPARYSAAALLRRGLSLIAQWPPVLACRHPLKSSYDVVIIGGGVHGLAAAYYLAANHGITNVAVLDKGYIGGGGSGRNTAILRSNYLTPEGVRFYDRSVQLYQHLAADLNYNVMFSQRGHLTLAHNDASLRTMRWRAEVNKAAGRRLRGHRPGRGQAAGAVPRHLSAAARYPILGALYHPPGGIIRHDAVVWGYARGAAAPRRPHPPEHRGHRHRRRRRPGHGRAGRAGGDIATPRRAQRHRRLVHADRRHGRGARCRSDLPAAGRGHRAGEAVPDTVIVSGTLHVYVSQTDRGELVFGASVDPFTSYSTRGSLEFIEGLAGHVLRAHARPGQDPAAAAVGRAVRHDAGLLADHGHRRRWRASVDVGLGHLRVQGRPGVGRGDGPVHRRGPAARDHRRLRAGPLRRRRARRREGRGRRRATEPERSLA